MERLRILDGELQDAVASRPSGRNAILLSSSQAEGGEQITLRLAERLPLPADLSHRRIESHYVWVAAQDATLVAVDETDHGLLLQLEKGISPEALVANAGWNRVAALIGRLATAGFIAGIEGYRDRTPAKVERFARAHLTRACQLECAHCYSDSSPRVDRTGELSTERWARFIDDFAAIGGEQILFTGGEALLHRGCTELMAHAKSRGLHVTLFSNGLFVPKFAAEIHRSADQVQISLDGPTPELNNAIRGPNTYQHIVRAIDILAEQGTPIRIGMTAVPNEWRRWVSNFEKIRDRYAGHPNVSFKLSYGIMSYGRGTDIDSAEIVDRSEVNKYLDEVNKIGGAKIMRARAGCGYAEQIVVGPNGGIYPCHLLDSPVCHVDDHPLRQIADLLGGVVEAFDVDHVEGCKDCEIRYICGGSCRVLAGRAKGSRLLNTCTPEDKLQKYRNMTETYLQSNPA